MATEAIMNLSSHSCESLCKEIHDSWGQPNHLVQALATRTQLECQKIRETYMAMYGEDLSHSLQNAQMISQKDELPVSAKTNAALAMLMHNPHQRDAAVARDALEESDINYKALIEIFAGRKSSHVLLIRQAYQARFRSLLDQDIISIEPPHPYQRILMALAASHKGHHADVSQHIGKCDARRLYQTGEGRPGAIDEAVVLEILSKRSVPQLKQTFSCYKHIYGHNYTKSLKNANHGGFEDALKQLVKCIYKPPKYYAKTLYASIKGRSTDKGALVRVMVRRSEVDMGEIQRVFKKKYGIELKDAICETIPAGDYRDFLVALATRTATATAISA